MKEKEKSSLPYHRCAVMTMSLQFLAHETIEGVSLGWLEIPSFLKTNSFHGPPHPVYLLLNIEDACCTLASTLREVKKVLRLPVSLDAGFDARLGSTALRSLLPAARLRLSGKKLPEWIVYGRTGVGNKTGQWTHTMDSEER
ncbi:hypothetical protein Q8A73_009998 [Channa argus]|nr:hypothetical protein Q8A73_009998 [Channa argus]